MYNSDTSSDSDQQAQKDHNGYAIKKYPNNPVLGQIGLSQQCRPRSDACSGSTLFATHPAISKHTDRF